MSLIIYTPMAGDTLRDSLNALAMLAHSPTFETAISIMLTLAVCATLIMYFKTQSIATLGNYVIYSFVAIYLLLGITTTVNIVDMSDESSTYSVANVPIGVAIPGYIISSLGYGLAKGFAFYFHIPKDVDYNTTGMIFGSRIWTGATESNFNSNSELSFDLTNYITQCFFKSKILVSRKVTSSDLKDSAKLIDLLFKSPSPVYRIIMHDGQNLSCTDAAGLLKKQVEEGYVPELNKLALKLTKGNTEDAKNRLKAAHEYYSGTSYEAASLLTQNMLINEIRHAQRNVLAQTGSVGHLLNLSETNSQQKMRMAQANEFWLSEYQMPQLMSSLWIMLICMFPIVVLISFFPSCTKVYPYYIFSLVYLWSWPPLFILVHYYVSSHASETISLLGGKIGGITLSNVDQIKAIHSDWALTASRLCNLVPFIAYGIVRSLPSVMNYAAQSFTGLSQSISSSEAQTDTSGNLSLANYSGWNMNYDNTNAHKHDTNYTDMRGQKSIQAASGGIEHINAYNESSYSLGNSMTRSAVSVSGTDGLQSSLTHAQERSLQEMDGYRTSMDTSLTSASHNSAQFNESHGSDTRAGFGASSTESTSAQESLSRLKHKAQDIAEKTGISYDEAFTGLMRAGISGSAGLKTDKSLLGKAAEWTLGAHGEINVHAGGEQSQTDTSRYNEGTDYVISAREASDIRNDINTVQTYSNNHHVDDTKNSSESLLIQTGSNLNDAMVASDGYNAAVNKSERIADTQQHLKSAGASLTQDLNQQALRYGEDKVGKEHMRFLELNHQNPEAYQELTQVKEEFMEKKANDLIDNGISALKVNPSQTYNQASSSISGNRETLKNAHASLKEGFKQKSNQHSLGVNEQSKDKLYSEVNQHINSSHESFKESKSGLDNNFNKTLHNKDKKIESGREKANAIPVASSAYKHSPLNKKKDDK